MQLLVSALLIHSNDDLWPLDRNTCGSRSRCIPIKGSFPPETSCCELAVAHRIAIALSTDGALRIINDCFQSVHCWLLMPTDFA